MVRLAYNANDKLARIILQALVKEVKVTEIHIASVPIMWIDDSCYTGIREILGGVRKHFPSVKLDTISELGEVNAKNGCFRD